MSDKNIIIKCFECGKKNRVPDKRLEEKPICGHCKTLLDTKNIYGRPVVVSDRDFGEAVLGYSGAVLVDCWAPWCGPCKSIAPVLDELAYEFKGSIKITKLNVDENPLTASQYRVMSIPTLLFFKDGKLENTLVGALPKTEITKQIKSLI